MPVILSLETSTDVCSVALHDGINLLSDVIVREPQSHASKLAPLVNQVITKSGLSLKQIQAVAVASGPGSYTGLRIGASTAKGLCYGLDVPLIAVGTLELLAYQAQAFNDDRALLCPMIDARRMEVYCLVAEADLSIVYPVSARVVDASAFAELLKDRRMLFCGNGSGKCRDVIRHPHARFVDDLVPLASSLGEMAAKKYADRQFEDLVHFKPFYLKEFVAKKAASRI